MAMADNEAPKSPCDSYEEGLNSGVSILGSTNAQASSGHKKSSYPSHKHEQGNHRQAGSKCSSNGVPPFNSHESYYPPVMPHLYPPMVSSPFPLHGRGFQQYPPPFPVVESQMPKAAHVPAFVSHGHGIDFNAITQQSPRGDPNVKGANFSNRTPTYGTPSNLVSHYPQPFVPRDGMLNQPMTRGFIRPPFFGPNPGFVGGPGFPGPAPLYYVPAGGPVAPGHPFPQHFSPHPMNAMIPMPPPKKLALMENIIKQIDYYFSDENLVNDPYLISHMDAQGWVPISTIADFRRVKRMSTDTQFVLDALCSSKVVEVQDDKVRKRKNWSKYASPSERSRG